MLEKWSQYTNLDEEKQALAVDLGLEGRARETAMEIPAEDLDSENGMQRCLQSWTAFS